MEKRYVYADNAATTRVLPHILEAMTPYYLEEYGNASSGLYSFGQRARAALEDARERCAKMLGCDAAELYFTSGGTESDNWALLGAVRARKGKKHIISSSIEHPAVRNNLLKLEKEEGYEITWLDVYENGIVRPEDLRAALREDTALVTVMFANNEIGTIQPIKELCAIAHEKKVPFFCDAVQAVGHVDLDLHDLGVDLLSVSGHKLHTPKGIGALYIKKGMWIQNLIEGGGQEKRKRSGTENVAGAVALATALEYMCGEEGKKTREKILALREKLIDGLLEIPHVRLNGDRERRLPGNVNVSCRFIEGEGLIMWLDLMGVAASTGSACSTASLDPSHVLLAIGLPHEIAHGSLRLTLDVENTEEDVEFILDAVRKTLEKLRAMSPLSAEL